MASSYGHHSQYSLLQKVMQNKLRPTIGKKRPGFLQSESSSITTTHQRILPEWSPSCWANMSGRRWSIHVILFISLHANSGYFRRSKNIFMVTNLSQRKTLFSQ
ncbi:hypothetical protein PoB_000711100 [Plakobranchus ocellatus]|uniref:Uncharacterized protein n=1 Tax=Plakobranchus ocellatus TaxID=259542 RepID=A0AAV3YDY4_9GAST|nr:hypothetical protein PoB_000711100 [Plakobranchus ocellatus]